MALRFGGQALLEVNLPEVRKLVDRALKSVGSDGLNNVSSNRFDVSLSNAITQLQIKYSLISDGRIGNETYLLINEILFPEQTPTLRLRAQ